MTKRILIYGFPFFVLFIEAILREALSQGVNLHWNVIATIYPFAYISGFRLRFFGPA